MSGCGCGCASKSVGPVDESKKILQALASIAGPCGSKEIVDATGLDKKVVSDQIAALKKKGLVDSPARCKYGITAEGKASL
jgi:predicted transcriptional regulator